MAKIILVGDSPRVSTGFGRCTAAACDALVSRGHEVAVLGLNEYGDDSTTPDGYHVRLTAYPIYTCYNPLDSGRDVFGSTRLPVLAKRLQPDLILLLNDPWNVADYLSLLDRHEVTIPVAAWLAVDGRNQLAAPLNKLKHVIVWCKFAADELKLGGYEGPTSIVPLGVDTEVFRPIVDPNPLKVELPADSYIVGYVGRNQYRKRLDLTLEYFAAWIHTYSIDNAYLYLHLSPTGDMSANIQSLAKYHNILGKIILSQQRAGTGQSNEYLAHLYNNFDVYFTTTQGEGWGLGVLEAMACGTHCIVPDWSALGCWTRTAAVKVPCTTTALTAPVNGEMHTVGGIMDRDLAIAALHDQYTNHYDNPDGVKLASYLTWQNTGNKFVDTVESILDAAS